MPGYNPETDVDLYGIGSLEFPTTLYDRPKLMLANLVRGNVDAMTRSMLAPDTLTPHEAQTLTNKLLGKNPNKFLKTLTDVATNPLVIAGLALGVWKFPLGNTRYLIDLGAKSKVMGYALNGLHSALTGLRGIKATVSGKTLTLYEAFTEITKDQTKLIDEFAGDLKGIFKNFKRKYGKLTKDELIGVGAIADRRGMENTVRYAMRTNKAGVPYNPEAYASLKAAGYTGKKGESLLRGVSNTERGRQLQGLGDQVADWHKRLFNRFPQDLESRKELLGKIAARGDHMPFELGEKLEGYGLSHLVQMDKYAKRLARSSMNRMTYSQFMKDATPSITGSLKKDGMLSLAGSSDLTALAKLGWTPGDFNSAVNMGVQRRTGELATAIGGLWKQAVETTLPGNQTVFKFRRLFLKYFRATGPGRRFNLVPKLGGERDASAKILHMAGELQAARVAGTPARIASEINEMSSVIANPVRYTLNAADASQRYLSGMAASFPWIGRKSGSNLYKVLKDPAVKKIIDGNNHINDRIFNNLIPYYKGFKPWQQMQRAATVGQYKEKISSWLNYHPMALKMEKEAPGLMGIAKKFFAESIGPMGAEGAGAQISQWFYLSTLGANLSPAYKNLLQNPITAMMMPGIGPQGMARGMKTLWPRMMGGTTQVWDEAAGVFKKKTFKRGFLKSFKEEGSFKRHFPEYYEEIGMADAMTTAMRSGDIAEEGIGVPRMIGSKWETFKKALLMPFQTSEGFNRLLGFYAGQESHVHHLKAAGKVIGQEAVKDSMKVGRNLVDAAHFPGGPLGVPKMIQGWWSPARQFLHFPLRYAGFLQSSFRMGGKAGKWYGDWGTAGRVMAGSAATYEVGKNLMGVDLSSGLAMGALPIPQYENAPFHPMPLVSPAVGVLGSLVKAAYSGDTSHLGATAALLVPGGIAARRAYKTVAPKYADYKNRTPEGRIPVYNDSKALIGTYTPMQMFLRTIGIKPSNVAQEQGAAKWVLSQRDKIRGYRRDYLQALYGNDRAKANQIQGEFQKAYPEFGPMEVKKSDITALKNRREISRLNRIMKGLPKDYRPLFQQAVGEASLSQMTQDIEMNPGAMDIYFPQ